MGYNTGEMVTQYSNMADPSRDMPKPHSLLERAEQEKRLYTLPKDSAKEAIMMYSPLERELAQIKEESDPMDYIPLDKAIDSYCCQN